MNKLIHAYLIHIDHYLANRKIQRCYAKLEHDDLIYHVIIEESCNWLGYEDIEISNEDLLTFLYERTLNKED